MTMSKLERYEVKMLTKYLIIREDEMYIKRLELRKLNIEFNKAKKRIKELMNKDLN